MPARSIAADPASTGANRFELFVEMMPQPAWTARADGTIDFCNRRWREYTQLSLIQTRSPFPEGAIHPEDVERCAEHWREALKTGGRCEMECRLRRGADGAYCWHYLQAWPMREGEEGG